MPMIDVLIIFHKNADRGLITHNLEKLNIKYEEHGVSMITINSHLRSSQIKGILFNNIDDGDIPVFICEYNYYYGIIPKETYTNNSYDTSQT